MPGSSSIRLDRARRSAALFAEACWLPALGYPFFTIKAWFFDPVQELIHDHLLQNEPHYLTQGLQVGQRVAGAAVHLVPALLLAYGFLCARRSLLAFARGDMSDGEMARGLRDYAAFSFWSVVAHLLTWPVGSVAITLFNAPGHRELSVGINSSDVFGLVGAGIVWVVASAMAQASAAVRENAQFV